MYDARQIANCILDIADRRSVPITHLALQKIVYFAHGLSYSRFEKPLLLNKVEAWKNGPVVRELYFAFNSCGELPITERATLMNFESRAEETIKYTFSKEIESHLEEVFSVYGPLPAWRLVAMTHEKGTPWERTISASANRANVGMHIDEGLIREFFVKSLKRRT